MLKFSGNISFIDSVKIPRVQAPVVPSTSGSEGPLMSDTLPSDYPSESNSEVEDVDATSLPVSSAGSFDNRAFVQENTYYTTQYDHTTEEVENAITTMVPRLPLAVKDQPKFDVQVRVKRPPPSPPSLSLSDSESSIARTERNLSTILEQSEEKTQFTYVPELHPPPKHIQPAPTYNRILRRQQELLDTERVDTHTEITDVTRGKFAAPAPPPPPPIVPREQYTIDMEATETIEPPIAAVHKPDITSHVVDDVFLRTITEKKTIEDIERHKRLITEYHTRQKPVEDQKWDVTIKNYPVEMPEPPDWENFSDISSASGMTLTPKLERAQMSLPPQNTIDDNKLPLNSPELVGSIDHTSTRHATTTQEQESFLAAYKVPLHNPQVPNWNVLIRVLQPMEQEEGPVIENADVFNSQLTLADKMKWRQIITTESTLRTLLTEAIVREDFERIRHDRRYEKIFEPPKWDIIIRILTPIDKSKNQNRYKKKADWDNRSRRSSLPTLYEYDSDGGSSMRTLTNDPVNPNAPLRSRKPSRSSYRSEADLRSMSEVTVDFGRPDHGDSQSESSSYYPGAGRYYEDSEPDTEYKASSHNPSIARSLSQPSLARSASEFTERWVAPSRYDTASEFTSPEGTPKSQRSTKIQPLRIPRGSGERSTMWQTSSGGRTAHQEAGTSGQMMTQSEYRSEASTSFMGSRKNWMGDNYSEDSYK